MTSFRLYVLSFAQREFAVDVFDHHHGAVDDDSEIDGADGKQIGGNVVRMEHDEGKQKRERNGEGNNDGGAEADQEENQHNQNQHHAAKQVRFDRVGGQVDQFAAVIIRMNLDVGRQDLAVQFLGFCFNSFQDVLRLLPTQHENDAFDRIVIFLEAEFAQARRVPDGDISDIAHPDGHALVGADHDVANVIGVAHQPDAANVVELSALRIESAASIRSYWPRERP